MLSSSARVFEINRKNVTNRRNAWEFCLQNTRYSYTCISFIFSANITKQYIAPAASNFFLVCRRIANIQSYNSHRPGTMRCIRVSHPGTLLTLRTLHRANHSLSYGMQYMHIVLKLPRFNLFCKHSDTVHRKKKEIRRELDRMMNGIKK